MIVNNRSGEQIKMEVKIGRGVILLKIPIKKSGSKIMVKKAFGKSKKLRVSVKFLSSLNKIIDSGLSSIICPRRKA
jgi:hypothetical protein